MVHTCVLYCIDGTYCVLYCVYGTYCVLYCIYGTYCVLYCIDGTYCVLYCIDGTYCVLYYVDGTYCDEGWIGFNGNCYVLISGYSTTSYDDAEFKCADDYDGHLISILDSGDGDYWTTNFLKIFAERE